MQQPVAPSRTPESAPSTSTIAILGAGVAGLCMAIRLKQAGIHSFTIYENGGTPAVPTPAAFAEVPATACVSTQSAAA